MLGVVLSGELSCPSRSRTGPSEALRPAARPPARRPKRRAVERSDQALCISCGLREVECRLGVGGKNLGQVVRPAPPPSPLAESAASGGRAARSARGTAPPHDGV